MKKSHKAQFSAELEMFLHVLLNHLVTEVTFKFIVMQLGF